jgi:hypothetical protein
MMEGKKLSKNKKDFCEIRTSELSKNQNKKTNLSSNAAQVITQIDFF